MTVCLLLGSVTATALLSSIPLYTEGILQRLLVKDMEQSQISTGEFPGLYQIRTSLSSNTAVSYKTIGAYYEYDNRLKRKMIPQLGVPLVTTAHKLKISSVVMAPENPAEGEKNDLLNIEALEDINDHLRILYGRSFSIEPVDGIYEVIATEQAMALHGFQLDRIYEIADLSDEAPLRLKITGVFGTNDANDPYWHNGIREYNDSIIMDFSLFEKDFVRSGRLRYLQCEWLFALDYHKIHIKNLKHIAGSIEDHIKLYDDYRITYNIAALPLIRSYYVREGNLRSIMSFLNFPVLILLVLYVYIISFFVIENEKEEIAHLKSKGASSFQVFYIYFLESCILIFIAVIVGPPLGLFLCTVIGSSNGFLEFIQRTALQLGLSARSYLYALIGAFIFMVSMLIPALIGSRYSIVEFKSMSARGKAKSLWRRLYIDVVLLAVSGYGYYQYYTQQQVLKLTAIQATDLPVDPILFVISAIFTLSLSLMFQRIFPLLVRALFALRKKRWSPILFSALIHVSRTMSRETFFIVFFICTISFGMFSSKTARTINQNMEERIRYSIGAEVTLMEQWAGVETAIIGEPPPGITPPESGSKPQEPPFGRFANMESISDVTRVIRKYPVRASSARSTGSAELMGIIPHEFALVAWFRSDLLPVHWYEYNRLLTKSPMAALVSTALKDKMLLKVGDTFSVSWGEQPKIEFMVYGFIDYWPTYNPFYVGREYSRKNLIVANLNYIQLKSATEPYEVWLRIDSDHSSETLYGEFTNAGVKIDQISNANQEIIRQKNDPLLQGTNGALTLGFIVILAICTVGFLLYSILSFKSRILQFGIFRAMGLTKRNVFTMILLEQILITGTAILAGLLIGEITSRLFVPFIQILSNAEQQVPPFRVVSQTKDLVKLLIAIGFALFIGQATVRAFLSKLKVAEAVKLGEE